MLMGLLAAELRSTGGLYSPLYLSSILLTLHLMVWNWRVLRAGPILLYWAKLIGLLLFLLFFPSLLYSYRSVLWSSGLRTDGV